MQHQWQRKHSRRVVCQQWRLKSATAYLNVLVWMQHRKGKDSYRIGCQRGAVIYHAQKLNDLKRLPQVRKLQQAKVDKMAQLQKEVEALKRQLATGGDVEAINGTMASLRSRLSAVMME
tara:strand:+ start:214 stop:570 length:357 start_codon:yes stop_codon:yes gene_type:complete